MATTDTQLGLAHYAALDARLGHLVSLACEARTNGLHRGEARAELLAAAERFAGPGRHPAHAVLSRPEALESVRHAIMDQLR